MSIRVEDLTKTYGNQAAVDGVSFSIERGQICGFLGPNGAGKTTTMRMLTCFTTPTSGRATVAGFDIEKHPSEVRARLGYLPEHNPLYDSMYIREYLHHVARIYRLKDRKERVEKMIELTGLTREQHKVIGAISKGYRQRVGLAQAMIHDPEVLILDEPTSGLDPNQLTGIRKLITDIGKEKTVLFSSHIMQEVEVICDRILIIHDGKLVADESRETLQYRGEGKQGLEVLFEKPVSKDLLLGITGVEEIDVQSETAFCLWSDGEVDLRKETFLFASKNGCIILEMKRISESVEAVFQQLTKRKN